MGLRTQTFILGVAATLASPLGMALGLGEIKLKSSLNQPLNAEILLQQTRDLTDREILVGLASQADFDRVGVDKPALLGDLKFRVEPSGSGLVVRITSTKPIVEPYLNFIVQAQWPSGKLLREYTVLVDLPVYSGDNGDAVNAAQSTPRAADVPKVQTTITDSPKPSPRPAVASARSSAAAPRPARPAPEPKAEAPAPKPSGDTYGPVADNDTLWKIAKQSRPDAGVSIQQTMLAIQRLNPDAFVNGNINLLRKGQVLRLPAKDEASQIADDVARQEVASKATRRSEPAKDQTLKDENGPQLEASKTAVNNGNKAAAVEGRVKLSSSNAAEGSKTGRGAGTDKGNREALTNELSITKEELDAKNRASTDLKARLKAVDEQIETTEKLIQVNSEEMRKLELAIEKNHGAAGATPEAAPAEANKAATPSPEVSELYNKPSEGQAPSEAAPAANPPAPATNGPQETPPVAGPQETPPVTGPQETPPVKAVKPVATAPAAPSIVETLKANAAYIGLGIVALLGGGLLLAKRRRKEEGSSEPEFSFDPGSKDDTSWNFDAGLPAFDAPAASDDTQIHTPEVQSLSFAEPEQRVKLETDDVVSESDIHIALGDFDTAEKLLLSALEQDPANSRILLKLLEIYSRKSDVASFDPQFAKLRSFGDADAIERGEQLRSYIDGAPPFAAEQFSDAAFFAAVNATTPIEPLAKDAPLIADENTLPQKPSALNTLEEPLIADLEFDAALDDDFAVANDQTLIMPALGEDDSDTDFTLDFGDVDEVQIAQSSDRGSLAEALASAGSEDDLDLSAFDDLNFDLAVPAETSAGAETLADEEPLLESDFELDEASTPSSDAKFAIDPGLDAGLDDLDLDLGSLATPATADLTDEDDDYADLDLSALELDDAPSDDEEQDFSFVSAETQADLDDLDASLAERDQTDKDTEILDLDADDLLADGQDDHDYAALDFDFGDADLEGSDPAHALDTDSLDTGLDLDTESSDLAASDLAPEPEDAESPTLMMPAITNADLHSLAVDNLDLDDFDDLDADLGTLAENFEGDLAELDDLELSEPALLQSKPLLMDEPITEFGELDDVSPDEILGKPTSREPVELEDFDDSVTFPIEDPQTELDDPEILADSHDDLHGELLADEDFMGHEDLVIDADLLADTDDDLISEEALLKDLNARSSEFGTLSNLDDVAELDDFVEFEDLDSLDALADADSIDSDDPLILDSDALLEDDKLQIPASLAANAQHFEIPDFDPESDDDSDLGALCDGDELATKLDLLRAFVDMGDEDSAKHTLEEILEEGSDEQRKQAQELFDRLA